MSIIHKLQPLIDAIQNRIQNDVKDEFPRSLKEPIRYFLATPGKKIRPLLTLLCCRAAGGEIEKALPAAAGIELFHDFTLIHDDIMDRDELRRGRATIHRKWDEGTAILVGDALVGMAYSSMLQCESRYVPVVLSHFSEALIKVCEGQALDKEFESRYHIAEGEYLEMITKKTAWLFKLSCQIGAILGGANPQQQELWKQFGQKLGIGFQIQDDLLDFVADESKLGKKVGSDLTMEKKTYITIKYDQRMGSNPDLLSSYPEKIRQFDSFHQLKSALFDLGIVEETQRVSEQSIREALHILQKVPTERDGGDIHQMVRFLQTRQY